MTDQITEPEPLLPRELAAAVEHLAAIGGPDDTRPPEVLLEALEDAVAAVDRARAPDLLEQRQNGAWAEVLRHRDRARAEPAALGDLLKAVSSARLAFGAPQTRRLVPAHERVLGRLTAPALVHIPTGLRTLDTITRGGLLAQRVHVIGGEPDGGKTALLLQILMHATTLGFAAAFHAVDEPRGGIEDRVGQAHGLQLEDLEAGRPETIAELSRLMLDTPHLMLVDQDEDNLTIEDTAEALLLLAKRLGCKGAVLGIDSLQTARCRGLTGPGAPRTDRERIDVVTAVLKSLARQGLCVIVTSELSRGAYRSKKTADRTAELAAFKGSGSIEYAMMTGLILSPMRGEFYGDVRVGVPKNKRGEKGVAFRMVRDADRCTFTDRGRLDSEDKDEAPPPKPAGATAVPEKLLDRARYELRRRSKGVGGGIEGWAQLVGGKLTKARLACLHLEALGEVEHFRHEGQLLRRWRDPNAYRAPTVDQQFPTTPAGDPPANDGDQAT